MFFNVNQPPQPAPAPQSQPGPIQSQPPTPWVGRPMPMPAPFMGSPIPWTVPVVPMTTQQLGIPVMFPTPPPFNPLSAGPTPLAGGPPFVPTSLQGPPQLTPEQARELAATMARYGTWGLTGVGVLSTLYPPARAALGLSELAAARMGALGGLGEMIFGLPQTVPTPGTGPWPALQPMPPLAGPVPGSFPQP